MSESGAPTGSLEAAAEAVGRGDFAAAASIYRELAEGERLPPSHALAAARALLQAPAGAGADLELAERLLARIEPGDPSHGEAVRMLPELLEKRGGRGPKDAADRARAHMRALLVADAEAAPAHWRGMFRALVRTAELEGTLPALDPTMPAAALLAPALEAHRRWRQGGPPEPAAQAYHRIADEPAVPVALLPYVLYWQGHLEEQAGRLADARTTFERLLTVGPPGKDGRTDVERRVAELGRRLEEGPVAALTRRVQDLMANGQGRRALELLETELHRSLEPAAEGDLRRLLARCLVDLGEHEMAKAQLERLARIDPAGARAQLAALEVRRRQEGRALQVVEPCEDASRHHAELARRLDEAGQLREAMAAMRQAYLAAPPGLEADRARRRAAAQAWHKLGDPVLAMEALAGLTPAARQAPDTARLEESVRKGVIERFQREIRLGLRVAAFQALAGLYQALPADEPLRREAVRLHLEELSACIYKRLRLRRTQLADALKGFAERGLGPWSLVRLPSEAEGSPRHLAALREELGVLDRFAAAIEARELQAVERSDASGVARRLEDRDGLRAMEALLGFAAELGERRSRLGTDNKVDDWREKLAAWLPDAAKALVQTDRGRSLTDAGDDLSGQVEAFLDLRYPR